MNVPQSTKSKQDWQTPAKLICAIRAMGFNVQWDCTAKNGKVAPGLDYQCAWDGLIRSWCRYDEPPLWWNFWNPPFRDIATWVCKAEAEFNVGAHSVGVAPANIETVWAGDVLACHGTLYVLSPRINFTGGKGSSAPHATMLIVFGDKEENRGKIFRHRWKP